MMTEEDKAAWSGVTDQAARYLFDTVSTVASAAILRGALSKLLALQGEEEKYRRAFVYQALMAATEAGIPCGIRVYEGTGTHGGMTAFIDLPGGQIGFDMVGDVTWSYTARGKILESIVDEYLKAQ